MSRFLTQFLIATLAAQLSAQETFYTAAPGSGICARAKAVIDNLGPTRGVPMAAGDFVERVQVGSREFPADGTPYFIPVAERLSAASFTMMGQDGKAIVVSSLKGQVVIIGLWSMECAPSLMELLELDGLQKRGAQYGFQVFPVNYDSGQDRWPRLIRYLKRVKDRLVDPKVYSPGVGKEGVNALASMVPALPALFVLDREGRLAVRYCGYKPGSLVNSISTILKEPRDAAATPAAVSDPPP